VSLIISPTPTDPSQRQFGTITRVQSASANSGNAAGASVTITFSSTLTVGNLIVFAICYNNNVAPRLDDAGSPARNRVPCGVARNAGPPTLTALGFCPVQTAGTTMTLQRFDGTNFVGAVVGVEYSGVKLRLDQTTTGAGATSTTEATDTITTTQPNEVVIAAMGTSGQYAAEQTGWLTGITNSFTSILQTSSFVNTAGNDRAVAFLERIVSAPGSYSTGGTQTSGGWANVIGSFVSD